MLNLNLKVLQLAKNSLINEIIFDHFNWCSIHVDVNVVQKVHFQRNDKIDTLHYFTSIDIQAFVLMDTHLYIRKYKHTHS